ncbi:competence protein ComJ [Massilia sp. TWP1-3-3]|uniref:competence protein ComJ n=1 Tax=Massilia sp. TWP1-3-3 TaxID=2804573 RepID=UPI003CEED3CF
MTNANFSLNVSYSQLCVFWETLDAPFNNWEQTHFEQGFAWRPGSACFRTIEETGKHEISVVISDHDVAVDPAAVRVIEVPFEIPNSVGLEVASVADSVMVSLAPASYSLRFELFEKAANGLVPVRLLFLTNVSPDFRVLRADPELQVPDILLKIAEPG